MEGPPGPTLEVPTVTTTETSASSGVQATGVGHVHGPTAIQVLQAALPTEVPSVPVPATALVAVAFRRVGAPIRQVQASTRMVVRQARPTTIRPDAAVRPPRATDYRRTGDELCFDFVCFW